MCIQWCCKNCIDNCTKLTHTWARERCNDYYIARSRNETTKDSDCPKGPWELRRAFHRHPYRGAQRCDDCRKGGRKNSKLLQSARQKANVALGEQPEYTGALYVGELEIPEHFHNVLEPGKVDAMKSNWESFSLANGHLPSDELEREWAKRFTALKDVGLDGGIGAQPSKANASSFREWMVSREDHNGENIAFAGEVPRSLHQQIHHPSTSSTDKRNEPFRSARQQVQHNTSPYKDKHIMTTVEEDASKNTHHNQIQYNISLGTSKSHRTTDEEKEAASRDPHCKASHNSNPTTRYSSSQSTRARPWDL